MKPSLFLCAAVAVFMLLPGSGALKAAVTQADLEEFLPPARMVHSGDSASGIAALEQIAPRNKFAAAALYLIYSRGYCGKAVDYPKAIRCFNSLYPSEFYARELMRFWGVNSFPPAGEVTSVVLRNEYGEYRKELTGTHPLRNCYRERIRNVGGVIPRAIFLVGLDAGKLKMETLRIAREMGSASAWLYQPVPNENPAAQKFAAKVDTLEKAVELGHVPSMIELAGICQKNGFGRPVDHRRAGELLRRAEQELLACREAGCTHAEAELKKVRTMLHAVPDFSKSTVGLLEDLLRNQSSRHPDLLLNAALADEIGKRNDHAECAFYRLLPQLDAPRKRAELRPELERIAEAGSAGAIRFLLETGDARKRSHYCYLAGKFGVRLPGATTSEACYREAYRQLQTWRFNLSGEEYVKELRLLAAVLPEAKEEFDREFGQEAGMETEAALRIARPESARAEWIELEGHKLLKVTVLPCDQPNYLDIALKPVPGEKFFEFSVHSMTSLPSNEVWIDLVRPDGSRSRCCVNETCWKARPERVRINIAPTRKNFELKIRWMGRTQ